jgi:predicted ester cyclase
VNRDEVEAFYRSYLGACNAHDFDRLDGFVAGDVRVNDRLQGLDDYRAGLREVVARYPDYRWNLRHLLVDDDRVAAHFADTGTGVPSGRQEFAFYVLRDGLIAEVWVTAT